MNALGRWCCHLTRSSEEVAVRGPYSMSSGRAAPPPGVAQKHVAVINDQHLVQQVLNYDDNTKSYKLRWTGCGAADDLWVSRADLPSCQRLVREFWARRKRKASGKAARLRKHPVEGYNPNCRCGESGSTTWAAVKPGQVLECGVKMARKIAGCVQGLVPRLLWWQADFCVVRVPGGVFCPSRKHTGSNYGTEASVLSCADDPSSGTLVTSAAGALSGSERGTHRPSTPLSGGPAKFRSPAFPPAIDSRT